MSQTLIRYDAMCRAIADAYSFDEVKDIHDKAAALELYHRQAHNIEAERQACEIRLRAERREGELLKQMEKAKGNRNDGEFGGRIARPPNDTPTLSDLGITKDQSSRAQRLADVPGDQFEAALSGVDKPSATGIIRSTQEPKPQVIDDTALWVWGQIRDFKRLGILEIDPQSLYATMTKHMIAETKEIAPVLASWLARLSK